MRAHTLHLIEPIELPVILELRALCNVLVVITQETTAGSGPVSKEGGVSVNCHKWQTLFNAHICVIVVPSSVRPPNRRSSRILSGTLAIVVTLTGICLRHI